VLAAVCAAAGVLVCGLYLVWLTTLARTGAFDLDAATIENPTRSFVAGVRPLLMACLALAVLARTDSRVHTPAALHFAFYSLGVGLIGTRSLLGGGWITPVAGALTALSYAALIRAAQRFPRALTPADFEPGSGAFATPGVVRSLLAWLLSPWVVWPIGFLLGGLYLFVTLPPVVGYLRMATVFVLATVYLACSFRLAEADGRRRIAWIALGAAIYPVVWATGVGVKAAAAGGSPAGWWWAVMTARYASLACFAVALLLRPGRSGERE
jgi:hypothetical protein